MIDFKSELGRQAKHLLDSEYVIWLVTVGSDGTPQPRPVWFIWDNDAVLIYSKPSAAKLKHIASHPQVALHFNSDREAGENILVLTGHAAVATGTPALNVPAYMKKYKSGITGIGMTAQSFSDSYSVAIRIAPERVRE
jgi:PPOX class probable F420-dependent enzyme